MKSDLKATIIACLFTLIMSVGGAYTVLMSHDAVSAVRIDKLEDLSCKQGQMLTTLSLDIQSLRGSTDNTKDAMRALTCSLDEFNRQLSGLSTVIGRLDERLKHVEKK